MHCTLGCWTVGWLVATTSLCPIEIYPRCAQVLSGVSVIAQSCSLRVGVHANLAYLACWYAWHSLYWMHAVGKVCRSCACQEGVESASYHRREALPDQSAPRRKSHGIQAHSLISGDVRLVRAQHVDNCQPQLLAQPKDLIRIPLFQGRFFLMHHSIRLDYLRSHQPVLQSHRVHQVVLRSTRFIFWHDVRERRGQR